MELEEELQIEEITFSQEILAIEDSICSLIANAKKGIESVYSTYALEHLIQFYSHEIFSFDESINKCSGQLQAFDRNTIDLRQDATQVANLRICIRKFFDSGEDLSRNLAMATFNKLQSPLKSNEVFDTRSENIQALGRTAHKPFDNQ
jgi:hypothetical protein